MLGLEGGRHNREDIYIYIYIHTYIYTYTHTHILIADSLYHTEETNTTL